MWSRQTGGHCHRQLSEEVSARIAGAVTASRSEASAGGLTYTSAWRRFERWCTAHGRTALPSHPVTAAAYLVDVATYGMGGERAYAPVALARRVEAIGYHHRTTGRCAPALPAPCASAVAPSPLGP